MLERSIAVVGAGLGSSRFDTGPSLFALREVFARLFSEVGGEVHEHTTVVSNVDVMTVYTSLLDGRCRRSRRHLHREPSSSGVVFLWGLNEPFPELGLHNIFFSKEYFFGSDGVREHQVENHIYRAIVEEEAIMRETG